MKSVLQNATIKIRQNADAGLVDAVEQQDSDSLMEVFFKLNPADLTNDDKEKLKEIKEWAISEGDNDEFSALQALRDLRFRLGTSGFKEVHRYIRLKDQAHKLLNKAKAMEE